MSRKKWFISAFLVFHLIGVIMTPNLSSYTADKWLAPVYLPYMHFFNLGGVWSFFAPEPFSPPLFVDYVIKREGDMPVSGRFPPEEDPYYFRPRYNRLTSLARFILNDPAHAEHMMMNYLCHKYPKATSAEFWAVRGLQPDFDSVRERGVKMSVTVDYKSEFFGSFACKGEDE